MVSPWVLSDPMLFDLSENILSVRGPGWRVEDGTGDDDEVLESDVILCLLISGLLSFAVMLLSLGGLCPRSVTETAGKSFGVSFGL